MERILKIYKLSKVKKAKIFLPCTLEIKCMKIIASIEWIET